MHLAAVWGLGLAPECQSPRFRYQMTFQARNCHKPSQRHDSSVNLVIPVIAMMTLTEKTRLKLLEKCNSSELRSVRIDDVSPIPHGIAPH